MRGLIQSDRLVATGIFVLASAVVSERLLLLALWGGHLGWELGNGYRSSAPAMASGGCATA